LRAICGVATNRPLNAPLPAGKSEPGFPDNILKKIVIFAADGTNFALSSHRRENTGAILSARTVIFVTFPVCISGPVMSVFAGYSAMTFRIESRSG
jgi:hypothetical protein